MMYICKKILFCTSIGSVGIKKHWGDPNPVDVDCFPHWETFLGYLRFLDAYTLNWENQVRTRSNFIWSTLSLGTCSTPNVRFESVINSLKHVLEGSTNRGTQNGVVSHHGSCVKNCHVEYPPFWTQHDEIQQKFDDHWLYPKHISRIFHMKIQICLLVIKWFSRPIPL